MAVQLVLALLALSSLSTSAEPDCKDLVKPLVLEDRSPLYGKWIFHAGTSDNEVFLKELKTCYSSWIDLLPTSDSAVVTLRWRDRIDGNCCLPGEVNSTFSGVNTKVTFHFEIYSTKHDGKYLETCPDCIVWTVSKGMTTTEGMKQGRHIFIFTRTGKLEASQLEVFKKQAACLNFLSEIHFGDTNLCPDEKEAPSQ